jgi:hypothetical protein
VCLSEVGYHNHFQIPMIQYYNSRLNSRGLGLEQIYDWVRIGTRSTFDSRHTCRSRGRTVYSKRRGTCANPPQGKTASSHIDKHVGKGVRTWVR